ncbi:MAG: TIGR02530 family flagellar biosynthesis protein [Lachnospiraceae bacterium]
MDFAQNAYLSIDQVAGTYLNNINKTTEVKNNGSEQVVSFQEVLQKKREASERSSELVFSKHANERLATRNINLTENQIDRLNNGLKQAKEKKINESLVMMDNIAFIVNVKNNVVVTAMDQETNDNNVFTNIDGAVIV